MSDSKNTSFYSPGLITQEVHDFYGKALRVSDSRSVVDKFYTHFRVTYTPENFPKEVSYYRGTQAHKTSIGCSSDVNRSLQNKAIKLFTAPDNKAYHLWFNVDGEGEAPVVQGSTAIEVPINSNDDAPVVAMAITLVLNTLHRNDFYTTRANSAVEISTVGMGVVTNSTDLGTGFAILNTPGKQETVSFVEIGYDGVHPIYKGQVLKNYMFNVFSGQFELKKDLEATSSESVTWDEISTTFPEVNKDLHTYKKNSITVQETLVTYTDSNKKQIASVKKTRF
jgi:hypothetical protein